MRTGAASRLGSIALAITAMLALAELGGPTQLGRAQGKGFFKSSPGQLTREHRTLDSPSRCNDCHVNGTKRLSNSKCLGCHDHRDLRARINAGKGFHATSRVRGRKCEQCHSEHEGLSFNIMGWRTMPGGQQGFDHALAGWPLREKHKVLSCARCHTGRNNSGRRIFLGESTLCGTCHRRDQPHRFDRRHNMRCERCHTETSWSHERQPMDFDHNKKSDAEFPMEGSHTLVTCSKCHPKDRYNLRLRNPGDCRNCHKSSHKGHLFDRKRCSWCHSPRFRSLEKFRFDHPGRTRFKLVGKHAPVSCYQCHTKARGTRKPSRACQGCHAADSRHGRRFRQFGNPPRCDVCHTEGSFRGKKVFDHDRRTNFRLYGSHKTITCDRCHRGGPRQFEDFRKQIPRGLRCMSCHAHENAHDGEHTDLPEREANKVGKKTCLSCHTKPGVLEMSKRSQPYTENHGPGSKWPITGAHDKAGCRDCHRGVGATAFKDTPAQCAVRCHKDSLHEGRLGDECDKCHEPGVWKAVRFDHDQQSDFALLGEHVELPCGDCHPDHPLSKRYKGVSQRCAGSACHADDDAHRGRLGTECQTCHLETAENIFDHNAQSDFKLDGRHLTTQCSDCHPSITFKPRPKDCYGGGVCHPEPAVHKGQYGSLCDECHNTTTFKQIKPLHDAGDFSLNGMHDRLPCRRCHPDNRPLAGSGNFCINCHRQDDIHSNSLSPRCGTCHTQWSFAPATFDHSTVGCNLTGLHRTLPCFDCHKNGNFRGLSGTCFSCHIDLAQRPDIVGITQGVGGNGQPIRVHVGVVSCSNCHNINFWSPANVAPHLRESVCL